MSIPKKIFKTEQFQRHCCVPFCSASSKCNSFHSFPTDSDLRKQWLINIRRDPYTVTAHTKICSGHFTSDQLIEPTSLTGGRRLVKGAVPTLFQWNICEGKTEPPPPLQKRERDKPITKLFSWRGILLPPPTLDGSILGKHSKRPVMCSFI
uniref:THAP domain-containing protein 1 n=1 Tax=Poecilia mexicana TaxID=48701 RepID=A0A3B3XF27_9TELE